MYKLNVNRKVILLVLGVSCLVSIFLFGSLKTEAATAYDHKISRSFITLVKEEEPQIPNPEKPTPNTPDIPDNNKPSTNGDNGVQGLLPQTGEERALILTFVGTILIGCLTILFIRFRRIRREQK